MATHKSSTANPAPAATQPMMEWWQTQWRRNAVPMARVQLAWMESIAEAMYFEAQVLKAIAESNQRLAGCFQGEDAPCTPQEFQASYQQLIQDVTDAQMERLQKATELSMDFRRQVWEEI
ncbi:hypothetical protein [Halomonas sp.]|jgi:hypothetical protein|uniref:hypothetical protein n=1 Tax=Halomonas sp. TaxID=1486246 RepID=UPI0035652307